MYEVKTIENFSGPLEKLLELIELKKLDITTISLADVTADFLSYVENLKKTIATSHDDGDDDSTSSRVLADFLVVAAQLLLIKSKALLPDLVLSQEEEESIVDLERRLRIYGELKPMFALLKTTWTNATPSFSREFFKDIPVVFYPPKDVSPMHLHGALENLFALLGTLFVETEKIARSLITLEDKISEIFSRVSSGITRFSHILTEKTREESIVLFLALLHLLRDQTVTVKQDGMFGDIEIEKQSVV